MTLEEAQTLAKLLGYADGGCSNCVSGLVEHANVLFPAFRFVNTGEDVREQTDQYYEGEHETRVIVSVEAA